MSSSTRGLVLVFLVLLMAASAPAQRNALGQRLKLLEQAWAEKGADDAARRRALPAVNEAVTCFFSFRLAKAGEALDRARFLLDAEEIDPARAYASGLQVILSSRLVDPTAEALGVRITALYEAGSAPADLEIRLQLAAAGQRIGDPIVVDLSTREASLRLPKEIVNSGLDCELLVTIAKGERELARFVHAVAFVPRIDARLAALQAVTRDVVEVDEAGDWRRSSAGAIAADLDRLRSGKEPEGEPTAASMLAQAEAWVGKDRPSRLGAGESLISFQAGSRRMRARIAVPEAADRKSPLLILVHGAGGSENMFFEALGGGIYVREGLARGAVVVAPKAPLFGSFDLVAMIDALKPLVSFDDGQVFVVGHSMGAGIALDCARKSPTRFAGVAAIAGGRPLRDPKQLVGLPLFLGTGAEDFGRNGVLALAASLAKVEGSEVELHDRPLSEHLMVVQDLVAEVFEFIDRIRAKKD